MNSFFSLA